VWTLVGTRGRPNCHHCGSGGSSNPWRQGYGRRGGARYARRSISVELQYCAAVHADWPRRSSPTIASIKPRQSGSKDSMWAVPAAQFQYKHRKSTANTPSENAINRSGAALRNTRPSMEAIVTRRKCRARTSRQSAGGHSGQVSPIESSTSRTAATTSSGETPNGGSWRAMTRARSRACGSARSCIQLVLVALTDRARLLQHRDRPAPQRPDRGPPFLRHQHRENFLPGTNPCGPSAVPAADTGHGFRVAVVPRVPAPRAPRRLSRV
jgi:hypothetical protein